MANVAMAGDRHHRAAVPTGYVSSAVQASPEQTEMIGSVEISSPGAAVMRDEVIALKTDVFTWTRVPRENGCSRRIIKMAIDLLFDEVRCSQPNLPEGLHNISLNGGVTPNFALKLL